MAEKDYSDVAWRLICMGGGVEIGKSFWGSYRWDDGGLD